MITEKASNENLKKFNWQFADIRGSGRIILCGWRIGTYPIRKYSDRKRMEQNFIRNLRIGSDQMADERLSDPLESLVRYAT